VIPYYLSLFKKPQLIFCLGKPPLSEAYFGALASRIAIMFATFLQQAALVTLLLGQLTLGAVPAKQYDGRYVTLSDNGIGGTYPGAGVSITNPEIAQLAKDAMLDARAVAREARKPEPKTLAVYINPQGDLILGGSGGGTSRDAEANILAICAEQGLPFEGGRIVSWNFTFKYFIPACADCQVILLAHGEIKDMIEDFRQYRDRRRSVIDKAAWDLEF
jgi:hypothetical protein